LILKLLRPESCGPWPKCYDVAVERERKKRNTERRIMAFLLRLLLRSQSHDYICSSGGGAVLHTLDMALCDRALHTFEQPTLRITTLSTPTWSASSCTGKGSWNQLPPFLIMLRRAKNKLALSRLQTLCRKTKKKTKKQTNATETQRNQSSTRSSGSAQYPIFYSPRRRTKLTIKPTRPI